MNRISFQFHRADHIVGLLIRLFSRGKFNHTSIRVGNTVYEAHMTSGVRKVKYDQWHGKSTVVDAFDFEVDDATHGRIRYFLERQVGKKYDWGGVMSFLWVMTNPKEGRWFCSELSMVALMKMRGIRNDAYNQRQSPQDFFCTMSMIAELDKRCDNSKL